MVSEEGGRGGGREGGRDIGRERGCGREKNGEGGRGEERDLLGRDIHRKKESDIETDTKTETENDTET